MAGNDLPLQPVEGQVIPSSPLKTLGLCLLAIYVLAPVGAGLVWAWWEEASFLDRRISWYGALIGALFVLGGICAIPVSFLCFIRRSQLILGRDSFQLVRGEKVTIQIPYANIARIGMDETELTGKFIGVDLADVNEAETLCPGAEATKNEFGWNYRVSDESWTVPLTKIFEQISKHLTL